MTKVDDGDAPIGGFFNYTIVAGNSGPDAADGATVVDYFATDLTCSWSCTGAGGAACRAAGDGHVVDAPLLPVGGTATYTANCLVDPAATGTVDNTVAIWPPLGTADPTQANNGASESTNLFPEADVGIDKTNSMNEVASGSTVVYEIAVWSFGPSAVTGVTVSDVIPPELESCTWSCDADDGATCTAGGIGSIDDAVSLPAMSWMLYTVTCTVKAGASGSLSNTATVTLAAGSIDPDLSDNSSTDSDTIVAAGTCGSPDSRDLSGLEIEDQRTYEACVSITAGDLKVRAPDGNVILRAGSSVSFGDGFAVEGGCEFYVELNPAMLP